MHTERLQKEKNKHACGAVWGCSCFVAPLSRQCVNNWLLCSCLCRQTKTACEPVVTQSEEWLQQLPYEDYTVLNAHLTTFQTSDTQRLQGNSNQCPSHLPSNSSEAPLNRMHAPPHLWLQGVVAELTSDGIRCTADLVFQPAVSLLGCFSPKPASGHVQERLAIGRGHIYWL